MKKPLPHSALLVGICLLSVASAAKESSSGGVTVASDYEVTASLNPLFIHPQTGEDLTDGEPLVPSQGPFRGADSGLYAIRQTSDEYFFSIIRSDPATGVSTVLYVIETDADDAPTTIYRGYNGRFYFTLKDSAHVRFQAPGTAVETSCNYGCLMYLDTLNGGKTLDALFSVDQSAEFGTYPEDDVIVEDTSGNVYFETRSSNLCPQGGLQDEGALIRVSPTGVGTVLESYGCGQPPFDWSTVTPSGNNDPGQFSNGRQYRINGQAIEELDPANGWTVVTTIDPSDGAPFGELTDGGGYLYGMTYSGGALNGGVVFRVRIESLATPDLLVTAVSDPPAALTPGLAFDVEDTTHNSGPEAAGASTTLFHLSTDGTERTIKLAHGRDVPGLANGADSTGFTNVTVPRNTPVGTYWLLACADATRDVVETNDDNNCIASAGQVTIVTPDLRQLSTSTAVTAAAPGAKIEVNDTVENATAAPVRDSATRFYLSLDTARDGGDILLNGKRTVPTLDAGASSAGVTLVRLPDSVPAAAYYLLVCADDQAKIAESDETNNCAATATTLQVSLPDLVVTALSEPPATIAAGGRFDVETSVLNQGAIASAASSTRFYFSTDATKGAGDVLLTGAQSVPSLGVAASASATRHVTVAALPGTYYLIACADDVDKVVESDSANNCRVSATTVTVTP